jgi:hypothetical protein
MIDEPESSLICLPCCASPLQYRFGRYSSKQLEEDTKLDYVTSFPPSWRKEQPWLVSEASRKEEARVCGPIENAATKLFAVLCCVACCSCDRLLHNCFWERTYYCGCFLIAYMYLQDTA